MFEAQILSGRMEDVLDLLSYSLELPQASLSLPLCYLLEMGHEWGVKMKKNGFRRV